MQTAANTKVNTRVVVTATKQEGEVIAHDTLSVSIRLDDGEIINLQKGLGLYFSKDDSLGDQVHEDMALVGKRPFPDDDGNTKQPYAEQVGSTHAKPKQDPEPEKTSGKSSTKKG